MCYLALSILSGCRGQQSKQRHPDFPLPDHSSSSSWETLIHYLYLHWNIPKPAKRYDLTCPVSVPGSHTGRTKPHLGGDNLVWCWTTSTGCSQWGAAAAPLWPPPEWLSSSLISINDMCLNITAIDWFSRWLRPPLVWLLPAPQKKKAAGQKSLTSSGWCYSGYIHLLLVCSSVFI